MSSENFLPYNPVRNIALHCKLNCNIYYDNNNMYDNNKNTVFKKLDII